MKKIVFFVLIIISTFCKSQEQIDFNIKYLPNYNYTLSLNQTSENSVKYIGSEDILLALKNKGIENPTLSKDTIILKSISKTGNLKNNEFPINIELLESNNSVLTKGTKFSGKYINQKIKIDSIFSSIMTKNQKEALMKMMESVFNQVEFPNKKVKVGESFNQETTMSIPIENVNLEMNINSLYTLKNIENGIGYFNLNQEYSIKSKIEGYDAKITGSGVGKIHYDIENKFYKKYFLEMNMSLNIDIKPIIIEINSKSIFEQNTEIKKTKE
ncbi:MULTISPECIES: hypothetical protein [Empedobacter]|uniref:Uncharacterized protein n=1 Tax=Empedobacter falsenii TaxID=343874 RepID=A0A427BP68_9FLAO|nr:MULTISPECIES: hypothetical protein [Empedobacter]MDH2205485.1 hypothetical protein [Empedobacter sp. GD03644]QLL59217.1 hypothetical protein FH779_14475 [Empedobacter falsenii]RRT91711.1 hypothetical protein EGI89_07995 [Empedobacter falsenii]RRT91940.1 hypothetical protein EGI88_07525 [Empedobacter falsenii]